MLHGLIWWVALEFHWVSGLWHDHLGRDLEFTGQKGRIWIPIHSTHGVLSPLGVSANTVFWEKGKSIAWSSDSGIFSHSTAWPFG